MEVKSLQVGNTTIKNNIFLAPIAGYTDYAFRKATYPLGYGLRFTELVSAKGLFFGGNNSAELLRADDHSNTVAQLFGADPFYLRNACESEYLKDYKIVDINMGCPVPKVYKNGEGSALLTDIHLAERIVKECVKSGKIITIKIRKGLKAGDDVATDFAIMAETNGASLITIHARNREDYYSGEPDYDSIRRAKQSVKIPVIANGGIFTPQDADKMINETGADGIMLARGGIANPFLVCDILKTERPTDLKTFILEHFNLMVNSIGESRAVPEFRKFVPYYFKGMDNAKTIKLAINGAENSGQVVSAIKQFFDAEIK